MPDDTKLADLLNAGPEGLRPELLGEIGQPIFSRDLPKIPYDFEDDDLVQASMTALLLGQPLILAGNPGVGKTQFAIALADRLGLPPPEKHQVKSSDEGRDLLYSFDQVGHYRSKEQSALSRHVHFTALGLGILRSAGAEAEVKLGTIPLDKIIDAEQATAMRADGGTLRLKHLFPNAFDNDLDSQVRSVVLLDELDKAPRDAPNDILGEIEGMEFRIAELDIVLAADPHFWPVVLITTNSEQSMPDAFLRRCVFHWIADPTRTRLNRIVALHLLHRYNINVAADAPLLRSAADVFEGLMQERMNKKPATAEFMSFVFNLWERGLDANDEVSASDPEVRASIGTMLKTRSDRDDYLGKIDG